MRLRQAALAAAMASLALPALAMDEMVIVNKENLKWGDAPPVIPKGAKIAVLSGDPGEPGPFAMRLMIPANYKIAPHWHSQAEALTVLQGALYLGMGDKADAKMAKAVKRDGFHYLPAKQHHYAYTRGAATVVQINGEGPFDITYLDPKDDPSKK